MAGVTHIPTDVCSSYDIFQRQLQESIFGLSKVCMQSMWKPKNQTACPLDRESWVTHGPFSEVEVPSFCLVDCGIRSAWSHEFVIASCGIMWLHFYWGNSCIIRVRVLKRLDENDEV